MIKKDYSFEGFSGETTDILWTLRFNNNKEWYAENKDKYNEYVHRPVVALSELIFQKMREMNSSFDARPKVSRAHRDTRFSKNKMPFKECKWFFLRGDGKISIEHNKPTYFFEISPEWYRFGIGYWPEKAAGMVNFRKKIDANPAEFERIVKELNIQDFFTLENEKYKRDLAKGLPDEIAEYYNSKNITLMRYGKHEGIFYKPDLLDYVLDGFKKLYPIYQYFDIVADMAGI